MKRFGFFTLALALCAAIGSADARGPFGSIKVGNWSGGAYTNDQTGAFTHCAAGATYQSGIYFVVSVGDDLSWRLGFAHQNWKLNSGEAFPVALTFDGQSPFNVYAKPLNANLLQVDMPPNSALITQFRKAKVMTAFTQGQLFQFSLGQTAQLLPSLLNCVLSVKKNGVANSGDFAVAPAVAKPVAATAAAPSSAPPSKPAKTFDQTGTGFVVSANGHVVTNQHVVDGCIDDIQGNLTGEAPVKLRLVSSDETNDLALLQAPGTFKDAAVIREKAIRSGDSVVAIGFPFHGLLACRQPANVSPGNSGLSLKTLPTTACGPAKKWATGTVWSKFTTGYGFYEARIRIADISGINNAFWVVTTVDRDCPRSPAAGAR